MEQSVFNNFVSKSITEARNYLGGNFKRTSNIVGPNKQPVMKILMFNGPFPCLPNNNPMCDISQLNDWPEGFDPEEMVQFAARCMERLH